MEDTLTVPLEAPTETDASQFFGHPAGLRVLFFTEMWERFSYYGMRALLILFMVAPAASGGFGFSTAKAAAIYGWYTSLVYLACIPGGWVADRYLGQRRAILIGGCSLTLGHFLLAFVSQATFYAGLGCIIAGTGLLKANISTIVGGLYSKDDPRRDGGFSIFYMGINLGAMLSPLACGYLGQKVGWHYGFALAGVGMALGLVQYVLGAKHLGDVGLRPEGAEASADAAVPLAKHLAADAAAFALSYLAWGVVGAIYCSVVTHFMFLLFFQGFTREEWKRVGAIGCFFAFAALFWGAFEQAGSSLNLFADQNTRNVFLGWQFPSSWYQSVNSVFIIALAPAFSWLWGALGKRNPSSPVKFAGGLLFVGLGFLVMAAAARVSGPSKVLVSPNWLVLCYLLHTIGELALSPVGLSLMTKLSPPRVVGMMMGVWFLAASLGNKIGGFAAGYFDTFPLPSLFGVVFATTTATALLALVLAKPIKGLMGDVA